MNWGQLFGSIGQAGSALYGYDQLMGQVDSDRTAMMEQLQGITQNVQNQGQFQPWSVRSGLGNTSYNADGSMSFGLNSRGANISDEQRAGASQMFGRATQDPTQREQDIYGRIRDMQLPGEERQYDSMNSSMFGSGRGGMTTEAYGGSPEQHAFGMAQSEARNAASFGAMNQAQQEMQNYANIGNQMFQNQFQPYQMAMQQGQMGMQNAGQVSQSNQNMAGLMAQLGLGGMTTGVNYSNIQGNALIGLMEALGQASQGAGSAFG